MQPASMRTVRRVSLKRGDEPRRVGCFNSGLKTRYHGLCRNQHSRNSFQLKENQCSDFKGMDDLLKDLPDAKFPLGDKGCDSDKIRVIFAG